MKKLIFFVILSGIVMIQCQRTHKLEYPETKKVDVVDNYFGVEVADPYRWLEDDTSEETKKWVEKQNEVTFDYLNSIPYRDDINERLTEIWDYPRYGTPFWQEDKYFHFKNEGMQDHSVLYVQEGLDGDSRVLIDPNEFSEDGTVSLSRYGVSKDAKYIAYGVSDGGSDWVEIFVKDIETGEKLDDHIKWVKFSGISWEGNGFYYSRYDEPEPGEKLSATNENHQVYYHELGTSQEEDELVYKNPDHPRRNYSASTTEDEKYLVLYESETTSGNAVYIKDLSNHGNSFVKIIEGFDYNNNVIDNYDGKFIVRTNHDASNYRLVIIDPDNPSPDQWEEILPEGENVLRGVSLVGGKMIANYMEDAKSKAFVYDLDGTKQHELELPALGSMGSLRGKKDENIAFFSFTSFTYPTSVFKYNIAENSYEPYFSPEIDFDPEEYETKQVFYTSKDGTEVPMFIVHKKGLELDGNNPTLMYGYGGFNASMTPSFNISRLLLLENGGVYAMPNIRGGGEYGKEWHKAGTKLEKQNTFDDFIAAGEYLIEEGYTSSEKLAIQGGSNGGLLVGAAMTQRPLLFQVALPAVGVLDMLRYHKFTIGWAWADDYGTSEDSVHFHNLYSYSPLHNVEEGVEYPATLVTTADHDDRVVPAHSFKFTAELQSKHKGDNPVLARVETRAGHGAGKPTWMVIEQVSDIYSFMFYNMGVSPKY